jgi:hypothetical protein
MRSMVEGAPRLTLLARLRLAAPEILPQRFGKPLFTFLVAFRHCGTCLDIQQGPRP